MDERDEGGYSIASGRNSIRNDFQDDYDFYLSDINHESPKKAVKIRVLNDKSTWISPGGDFNTADTDDENECDAQKRCNEEILLEDLTSYKQSIDELRMESRVLLQRSPRQEKLQKELNEVLKRPKEDITILKLLWKDRERIGLMISDLAEAKQTIFNLNAQVLKQKEKGKERRNWSNKKIDALEERIEMLKAKEKYKTADHLESVRLLNSEILQAKRESEESAKQKEILKEELTELAKVAQENKELRENLAVLKRTSKEYRKQEKDYLCAIQKKPKATQTDLTDGLSTGDNLEKNKQGKRKSRESSQKSETAIGDIRVTRRHTTAEKNDDKYKIRKKTVPSNNFTSRRKINCLDDCTPTTTSTPGIVDLDSDDDDLIRELFFKF